MGNRENEYGGYRAAGQLVAAIAEGMPIESVSTQGIAFKPMHARSTASPRCTALAGIAIGLAGIAALGRYRFGTPPAGEPKRCTPCVHWSFNKQQLDDFATVRELIAPIDPDDEQDILFQAWDQALAFMDDDATWDAIEFFASLLSAGEIDGADIDYPYPYER